MINLFDVFESLLPGSTLEMGERVYLLDGGIERHTITKITYTVEVTRKGMSIEKYYYLDEHYRSYHEDELTYFKEEEPSEE